MNTLHYKNCNISNKTLKMRNKLIYIINQNLIEKGENMTCK